MALLGQLAATAFVAGSLFSNATIPSSPAEPASAAPADSVFMLGVPYGTSFGSDGEYTESGATYNGAPVYTREGKGGMTWSLYKRQSGTWVVDFNDVSEGWEGTVAYTSAPQPFPWSTTAWTGDAVSFRSSKTFVHGVPYATLGSNGEYTITGQVHNHAPVFARTSENGMTWSLYKRQNGTWVVDFNDVSEGWEGTVAYTTEAMAWPWSAPSWNSPAQRVFTTESVYVYQASYATLGSAGEYVFSGRMYNDHPVYQRVAKDMTWSLYRRANGKWHIDFNEISEDWGGTVAYTTAASESPWGASWSRSEVVFRDASVVMSDNAYWSFGAAGAYTFTGKVYNDAPVYERAVKGTSWSLYKRANGKWHVDFNAVSESWSGTVDYTRDAAMTPWAAAWHDGESVAAQLD